MSIKFPILTSPPSKKFDFLNEFQEIVSSDFTELIVASPFVDVFIIENIIKRCIFKDRKIMVITRYGSTVITNSQRQNILKAVNKIVEYERKDSLLPKKILWLRNERLHAKFIIKDWETVLFGSQNFTKSGGLTGNYELGAMITDSDEVKKLRPFIEDIKLGSKKKPFYPKLRSF